MNDGAVEWDSILQDGDKQRTWLVIQSIAAALECADLVQLYGPSWSGGSAGVGMFFWYLFRANPDIRWRDAALRWLRHSLEHASVGSIGPSLFPGVAGIAWAVGHLDDALPENSVTDPRSGVDEHLLNRTSQRPWQEDYDLCRGLVGYGVYALARGTHSKGVQLLEQVVDRLAETAVATPDGTTWWTKSASLSEPQRAEYPKGYSNLGLAHGVAGVIALLGKACAAKIRLRVARPLLDETVRWLLAQRNSDHAGSYFGTLVPRDRQRRDRLVSRVAWCHGDLGLATALYTAGVDVNEAEWKRVAIEIARHSAQRPLMQSGVKDATLCHGSAGNGHIFNRFYHATRDGTFLDAARLWFEMTLRCNRPGTGVAGFRMWTGETDAIGRFLSNVPGVLQGAAGIGLALLAASSSIEPEWDSALLVTMRPESSQLNRLPVARHTRRTESIEPPSCDL